MNKIRILHVVSNLDLSNGITGVIMNYYRHLDLKKVQFDFLYFEDSDNSYENEIISLGGKLFKVNAPSSKNILTYKKYIVKHFYDINLEYDIVHSHELALLSLITEGLRRNGTKHIIAHSHSVAYSYQPLKAFRNYILSLPIKKISDSFCSCSLESASFWFGNSYVKNGKITLIKNAIDCEGFSYDIKIRNKIREKMNLDDKLVIGHVGRLSKEKNQLFLIDIFKEIQKKRPNSCLILVGEGPDYSKLKRKASLLKLDNKIIFLGKRDDVKDLYQSMDIFVFPSISEGLGMAVIEAQASGLPCVISDTVPREVAINESQFLSIKEDSLKWAKYVLGFESSRKNSINLMSKSGYCIKSEVKKLENYYKDIDGKIN